MIDEGYVKYKCNWIDCDFVQENQIKELNRVREKLYKLNLIGVYDNGIGFGNISIRLANSAQFLISGTGTGRLPSLNASHYTGVVEFDLDRNFLTCKGMIQASSESLTHAAIYQADPSVNAVIHVHHFELWQKLLDQVPTTARNCPYGTPEMAKEIFRLFNETKTNLTKKKILVMAGHQEGIISFGKDLEAAENIILKYYQN